MKRHSCVRFWVLCCAALCLLCLLLGVAQMLILPAHFGVTYENYTRIREGMTLEEVERVLGEPPGIFITKPWDNRDIMGMRATSFSFPPKVRAEDARSRWWLTDDAFIRVDLDENGRVDNCSFCLSSDGFKKSLDKSLPFAVRSRLWLNALRKRIT